MGVTLTERDLGRMRSGGGAYRLVDRGPAAPKGGEPPRPPSPPRTRRVRSDPPAPPPRREPERVELIDQRVAKIIAERAAAMAWRHGHPAGGISWSSRADDCRLRKLPGMLGAVALWSYEVTGRAHFGWVLAGVTVPWVAQIEAASGRVLGVQFPRRKR